MKHFFLKFFFGICALLFFSGMQLQAQTTVSGLVTDTDGSPLPGVNIKVEGTVSGTISNPSGEFSLKVQTPPPFNLIFSFVGYESQTITINSSNESGLSVSLTEETRLGKEVVVSASRVEESVMESPVTVEKMDILAIQQASTADFYDQISSMKGVYTATGSLTFSSLNTRGFATIANTRFVQLIDGMDNSAPLLNFPAGNVVGISELDVESVELVPGAASALYGPNAFNGILMMNSKSPFDYQGLSAQVKVGVTNSNSSDPGVRDQHGTQPYVSGAVRYAKSFLDDRLAFKVNFSYLQAQDWRANDYSTFRTVKSNIDSKNNPTAGSSAFDGLNLYGDEANITFSRLPASSRTALVNGVAAALAPSFAPSFGGSIPTATAVLQSALPNIFNGVSVNRTGFKEQDLLDNNDAKSIKADAAIHYRINDKMELSYTYRYGSGSTVYQGGERYALRDFSIQLQKLELKGENFFVRGYMSQTNDGDSYNLSALGAFANETISPTSAQWLPNYLANYAGALIRQNSAVLTNATSATPAQITASHIAARTAADATRPKVGTPEFNNLINDTRTNLFKRTPPGAGFVDDSRFYHVEFNYNFRDLWDFMEVQVGGNFRRYDLFSDNTVFNENTEDPTKNKRITIDEFGAYFQLMKRFADDRLKITASLRYDKNQNFDGQVTPRVSAVYSAGADRQHNFRASYQTGFRNPDTQAQFIFFPSSSGILLGGAQSNAERYGIYNGGALNTQGQPVNLKFIQPEKLTAIEVGYKSVINDNLFLDLNYYYNTYTDFISGLTVLNANPINTPNYTVATAGTALIRPYVNSEVPVNSQGIGIGATYNLPVANLVLSGNYSYADFSADLPKGSEFEVQFNTPLYRFTFGLESREIVENLGFALGYRWQEKFRWESAFGHGDVPAFGVLDAQINYKVPSIKTIFKIGGTNILGQDYRSNFGGPFVGQLYYVSITFDQFMR